jgi:diguanylate cyclase (GGDEF)-like protein
VRRARRYHFPLAFLMVGVDRFRQVVEVLDARDQARVVGRVMAAIVEDIRGIDHCVLFAPDKLLVYLPHTGHEGAKIVAERLREKLKAAKGPTLTISIGLASYEGEGEVSFGGLLCQASQSLKNAQQAGGDRVDEASPQGSPAPGPAAPAAGDDEDFF